MLPFHRISTQDSTEQRAVWYVGRGRWAPVGRDAVSAAAAAAERMQLIGGGRGQWLGGTMASAEHEPIMGVWGQSPQLGPRAEPLVRGSGGEAP